jgi:hypothetical protein
MESAMAWSKNSKSDLLREAMSLLDDAVSAFRNRGYARQHAVEQAALALGVSPRRARALLYGEAFAMPSEEFRAIQQRYLDHLDAEAENLNARFEAVKAKRRQMELGL